MKFLVLSFAVFAISCSHQKTVWLEKEKLHGPKEISLETNGRGTPWLAEIELKLREKGLLVKRFTSTVVRTDKSEKVDVSYSQASTRYVLRLSGDASSNRCFGGGYIFDSITAELYDSSENKTILNISDSGYSEGCFPAYSSMFDNISEQVRMAWEK